MSKINDTKSSTAPQPGKSDRKLNKKLDAIASVRMKALEQQEETNMTLLSVAAEAVAIATATRDFLQFVDYGVEIGASGFEPDSQYVEAATRIRDEIADNLTLLEW